MTVTLASLIARAKETGDCSQLSGLIPYNEFLGFSAEIEDGEPRGVLRFADHLIGNPQLPALHGGTLGALLESTAVLQLLWEVDTVVLPKIINITVEYLRSGRPEDTRAAGIVTKLGRRVASVRAEAWQGDRGKPIAIANAHFLLDPDGAGE